MDHTNNTRCGARLHMVGADHRKMMKQLKELKFCFTKIDLDLSGLQMVVPGAGRHG